MKVKEFVTSVAEKLKDVDQEATVIFVGTDGHVLAGAAGIDVYDYSKLGAYPVEVHFRGQA